MKDVFWGEFAASCLLADESAGKLVKVEPCKSTCIIGEELCGARPIEDEIVLRFRD